MNPENNNPLSNPFASSGISNNPDPATNISPTPIADALASAQDNLSAASMGASSNLGGSMGFDQISPVDSNMASLPPVDEPLVPAAPVPGSIGSAVSVPPVDPIASPDPSPLGGQPAAPASVPEASPAAPFNPFAPSNTASAPTATNPAPTSAPQPIPAPVPTPQSTKTPKAKIGAMTGILSILALLLLATTIIFAVLYFKEKSVVKQVFVPPISNEDTNSAITILSCSRSESREDPAATGNRVVTISYIGDKLSSFSSNLSLNYGSEDEANSVRDANASTVADMANLVGGTLSVDAAVNGNNYTYNITSQDGTEVAVNDVLNAIYGSVEGDNSLELNDVQVKYETEGFVCAEE